MAASKEAICNLALMRLGVLQQVVTLATDATVQALALRTCFDNCRDKVLGGAPWAFATRYFTLTLDETAATQNWASEWNYNYEYPATALRIRRILTGEGKRPAEPEPFEIWSETAGKRIFTNMEDAIAEATLQTTDTTLYDAPFDSALAWELAANIVIPLAVDPRFSGLARQMADMELSQAKRIMENEAIPPIEPDTIYVRSRQ